jgi:hypothetical protein
MTASLKQQARVMAAVQERQFVAYRQRDNGVAVEIARTGGASLAGALAELTQSGLAHKDTLLVQERHDGLRLHKLHAYRIRKGVAIYQRNPETGLSERIEPLKLDHLFSLPVDAFQPTRPFDALRDDPVGVDVGLIEGWSA